jgi:hypothetical protein
MVGHPIARLASLARWAVWAMWVNAAAPFALAVCVLASREVEGFDELGAVHRVTQWGQAAAYLIGAVPFMLWLGRSYEWGIYLTGSPNLREEEQRGLFLGFFVPVAFWVRPYQVVQALNVGIDPLSEPEPPPSPLDAPEGYRGRSSTLETAPPVAPPPVKLWWGLWLLTSALAFCPFIVADLERDPIYAQLALCVARSADAIAAAVVVSRLTARIVELARRKGVLREAHG